jgi:hypothetical protein
MADVKVKWSTARAIPGAPGPFQLVVELSTENYAASWLEAFKTEAGRLAKDMGGRRVISVDGKRLTMVPMDSDHLAGEQQMVESFLERVNRAHDELARQRQQSDDAALRASEARQAKADELTERLRQRKPPGAR